MFYAAATLWLMLIVLLAWGVHHLWSGLVKPRVVNSLLLPGTLVAQLGHVLGLLVTGGTVNNTALMKDDESGAPVAEADARPRLPVFGPIIVALLPIVALGGAIYVSAGQIGGPLLAQMPEMSADNTYVAQRVPDSLPFFWAQLRDLITLMERTVEALRRTDLMDWRNALFVYLLVCMSVRMAPLPGNLRGHLGAVLLTGLFAGVLGSFVPAVPEAIHSAWPAVTLTVATLLLLLVASLIVRGVTGLIRILAKG